MEPGRLSVTGFVELDRAQLVRALSPIFEGADLLADAVLEQPVGSWEDVLDLVAHYVNSMDEVDQVALLDAHARLGAAVRELHRISPASAFEQYGSGPAEVRVLDRLRELNTTYEARFGFRFVEFVAGRPLAAMVPVFESRLSRSRSEELRAGLLAFVAIARNRIERLGSRPPR